MNNSCQMLFIPFLLKDCNTPILPQCNYCKIEVKYLSSAFFQTSLSFHFPWSFCGLCSLPKSFWQTHPKAFLLQQKHVNHSKSLAFLLVMCYYVEGKLGVIFPSLTTLPINTIILITLSSFLTVSAYWHEDFSSPITRLQFPCVSDFP